MFGGGQKQGTAKTRARAATLNSIAGVMRGRSFRGRFDAAGDGYSFSYSPSKATVAGGKLQLIGSLSIVGERAGGRSGQRTLPGVRATLIAAQGGIGTAPPRKKLPADVTSPRSDLPIVESTGALSFAGVLYFKLAPLDGRALGVPADMKNLQLNARLAPVNDNERAMQAAFSTIVDALYGNQTDESAATEAIAELTKLLAAN